MFGRNTDTTNTDTGTTNTTVTHHGRRNRLVMARSRGAITGPLLILLGAWGALVPFIGHSFGYGFTPDNTWHWTAARGWLEVLPGAAVFLGGAILTTTSNRFNAMVGAWLAAVAGAWFVVGTVISPFWNAGNIGTPTGDAHHAVWERLGMFEGLGVVVVLLGAVALGRVTVVGARDIAAGEARRDAAIDLTDSTDSPAKESDGEVPPPPPAMPARNLSTSDT